MANEIELEKTIRRLLSDQLFGILATSGDIGPHTTIVSFVASDDLKTIAFATPRESRKYRNLCRNLEVSLFLDSRTNSQGALFEIWGIEARGSAREIDENDRGMYESIYFAKHPNLQEFAQSSALIRIDVDHYDIVNRFQNLTILKPSSYESKD